MGQAVAILGWLGVAWFLWSGHTDPLLLGLGAVSCGFVLWLSLRLKVVDRETEPFYLGYRPLLYVPWLLWEIAKANLQVAAVIWNPRLPIHPSLFRVPATQHTELGQVIYANSITLTPGTVALDVRDGHILVHALTLASARGILTGDMDRRVTRLERPTGTNS